MSVWDKVMRGEKLTQEDREQLKEEYLKERITQVNVEAKRRHVYGKEDMLNLPRHIKNCPRFLECPIDYKCRAYDSTYQECRDCILHEYNGICHKKELHNEKIFNMMITRERIDLDEIERKRNAKLS